MFSVFIIGGSMVGMGKGMGLIGFVFPVRKANDLGSAARQRSQQPGVEANWRRGMVATVPNLGEGSISYRNARVEIASGRRKPGYLK